MVEWNVDNGPVATEEISGLSGEMEHLLFFAVLEAVEPPRRFGLARFWRFVVLECDAIDSVGLSCKQTRRRKIGCITLVVVVLNVRCRGQRCGS